MSYLIVGDSCADLTEKLKTNHCIKSVPLTIELQGATIVDDDTFCQESFLKSVDASPECPRSACPSPEAYMQYFDQADEIFVVTLSGNLSGSYNSAMLAKSLYLEDHPDKKIHVFDSCSASVGETLLVLKLQELKEKNYSFEETIAKVNKLRDTKQTRFILETLDTFVKNGRIGNIAALIINTLNIKPIMKGTIDGMIEKLDQARGINKAISKMAERIGAEMKALETSPDKELHASERVLGISHCNNPERALLVRDAIMKYTHFKDVVIVNMAGISSMYANDGGIIVAY